MKAQNLSVCVPDSGCDKNCPYCVSEMTGGMSTDRAAMQRNLPEVLNLSRMAGVVVYHFDYCVQDDHGPDDIRSLIFAEDGHLYFAWNSPASILF